MAKLTIETELGKKSFEKQIEKLKADLKTDMGILEDDAKVSLKLDPESRRELEARIEKTRNQLISLQQQAQRTGEVGGRGFEKVIKSLKRFSLSLFGIQSIFSIISKASNTYLAQNEETANKLNAIWVALGNALAPIIEIIADGVLKLIGYLNVFLNALGFNVDLTKNMNKSTKAIKGTTNAMKELNNEVYSFDEINKQSKDTSVGGTSGGTSGTNGFVMPELNQDVVKFLQDTARRLRENWELLALIGGVIAGFKVAKWLSGLSSLIGGGKGASATGLLGLHNILAGLLELETIAIVVSVIYYGKELSELKKLNDEVSKFAKQNVRDAKRVNDQNLETAKSYEKGSQEISNYVRELQNQIEASKNTIEAKQKEKDSITGLNQLWDIFGGTTKKANEIQKAQLETIINTTKNMQELAIEGKLTDEQMKVYTDTMKYLNSVSKDYEEQQEINKIRSINSKLAIDNERESLNNQIKTLQEVDRQSKITTDNQKGQYESLWQTARNVFNNLNGLKATSTVEVKANTKKLTSVFDTLANTSAISPEFASKFSWVSNTLKKIGLAKGGIVNLPGRGVPLGNIVTGEATGGAEGFIPMNNEESMDLIGQSVARHVVINLTNNTMLDSRVIAREQVKIQDNQNFITNGRGV